MQKKPTIKLLERPREGDKKGEEEAQEADLSSPRLEGSKKESGGISPKAKEGTVTERDLAHITVNEVETHGEEAENQNLCGNDDGNLPGRSGTRRKPRPSTATSGPERPARW